MNCLTILLVLATALGAAEADTPKPAQAPLIPPAGTQSAPAQAVPAAPAITTAVPAKPACCCDAAGGRAALLVRPVPATPAPVASPSP